MGLLINKTKKYSHLLVAIMFLVYIYGCNDSVESEKEYYDNGALKKVIRYNNLNEKKAGTYSFRSYDEEGYLIESAEFKNNKLDGFFYRGSPQKGYMQIYEYKEGKPDGVGKKYQRGLLIVEVLFNDSIPVVERGLSKFVDSSSVSWGYIVYNYGKDTLVSKSQGNIVFKESFEELLLTEKREIDTLSTNYYLENLPDTINLKCFSEFVIDLSAIPMSSNYKYLYSELIVGELRGAYELVDTVKVFRSDEGIMQIKCEARSVFSKKNEHQSLTGLVSIYALDLRKDSVVKEVRTFFEEVFVKDE